MNFLKNIKGAKIPLSWMPKFYSDNPPFTQAGTKAIDAEISKLLKKWVIKPSIHEEGEYIFPISVTIKNDAGIDWF